MPNRSKSINYQATNKLNFAKTLDKQHLFSQAYTVNQLIFAGNFFPDFLE